MKKTFKFTVNATMEWDENETNEQQAHDDILSGIRDYALNKLVEEGLLDSDACIEELRIEDADDDEPSVSNSKDRDMAMRQMERELIDIVHENDEDGTLLIDDLGMSWSEECDGELHTKEITDISIEQTWDGDERLMVCFDDEESVPFMDCDEDDLGHNLADYIYEEVKAYY